MNDIENAIEILENYAPCSQINLYETHKFAIAALEKQVPKKPLEQQLNVNKNLIGLCSECETMWVNKYNDYCARCGQKLDWSEVRNE